MELMDRISIERKSLLYRVAEAIYVVLTAATGQLDHLTRNRERTSAIAEGLNQLDISEQRLRDRVNRLLI